MSKKIVYIIPRFTTGGAEKLVLEYAKYFQKLDYDITVISVVAGGEMESDFVRLGASVYIFKRYNIFCFFNNLKKINRLIKEINPEIIHSNMFSADLSAFFIKRKFKNIKWISSQHNVEYYSSFIRKFIWKKILQKADRVIAVAKKVFEFDTNYFKLNKNLLEIKNGVEVNKWLNNDKILEKENINFAIIGRLERQKAHKYLFEVLKDIKNKNWKLHIFGTGSLEDYLKKLAKEYNLENNLVWHGVSKKLPENIIDIDVIIQPSLWEGLSLVIMEMMSAGKLIIASKIAGEELIKDKKTGLIFKTKDFSELKEKIEYVFSHKEELKEIALAGQKYAIEHFDLENNLKKVEKTYQE
jgi:glycosyltransferase involved in cell wall biosynthesis